MITIRNSTTANTQEVYVAWEGDSLDVLKTFPKLVREELGADLRRLQEGKKPANSRPMKSIGKRVYELKQKDSQGWYRLIYLAKIEDVIYVLHCFRKKSRKTEIKNINTATKRLKDVYKRLREQVNNEKKK